MWHNLVFPIWFLAFVVAVVFILRWQVNRKGRRPPVAFKLRRGPGEQLRRRIAAFDENMLNGSIQLAIVPVVVGASTIWLVARAGEAWTAEALGLGLFTFSASAIAAGAWAIKKLHERRNLLLGYLGERTVGEALEPLMVDGYRIFHDVPAEGRGKEFNLDHVAVGRTGVTVIETKTRRKGRVRPGFKDHEVTFDGKRLVWPWGEDSHGIDQAVAEADYLRKWIKTRVNIDIPVKAILTLPGWWVNEKPAKLPIRVVNSKILPDVIRGRGERVLTDEQIDLIARQLDLVCRDVED
jgi:hypothetical protein